MGHWNIHILGHGNHHNDKPGDADQILQETVQRLRDAGQEVHAASITTGSVTHVGVPQETDPTPSEADIPRGQ